MQLKEIDATIKNGGSLPIYFPSLYRKSDGKYEELKRFPEKQFKRLTGVQRETFEKMVAILLEAQGKRYRKAGRKGVLNIEDRLLMALEYLREYRTYFHLGHTMVSVKAPVAVLVDG